MSDALALTLSTALAPAKKFSVDGEEYQLLGLDHLSGEDEARTMALFARHTLIAQDLEMTANVNRGTELALRLKKTRIQIICQVTDIPQEIAEKLPIPAQVKLLGAIQEELSGGDVDEEEDEESSQKITKKAKRSPRTPGVAVVDDDDDGDDGA